MDFDRTYAFELQDGSRVVVERFTGEGGAVALRVSSRKGEGWTGIEIPYLDASLLVQALHALTDVERPDALAIEATQIASRAIAASHDREGHFDSDLLEGWLSATLSRYLGTHPSDPIHEGFVAAVVDRTGRLQESAVVALAVLTPLLHCHLKIIQT